MSRILHVARRELLELTRQPVMLGVIVSLLSLIAVLVVSAIGLMQLVALDPAQVAQFESWFPAIGLGDMGIPELVSVLVTFGNFLLFSQYLGLASVLTGHTVLHDRQSNALPFLLLAPISRFELLLGKVIGAVAIPTAVFVVVDVTAMVLISAMPIAEPAAHLLPPSPAWLMAFLVGGPVWAIGVGIVCATVSAMARDVRTAQQVVWFIMFFATFSAGSLLAGRLEDGVLVQLVIALMGVTLAIGALFVGARVISRDLSR